MSYECGLRSEQLSLCDGVSVYASLKVSCGVMVRSIGWITIRM